MFKCYKAILGSKNFIVVNLIIPIIFFCFGLLKPVHNDDLISIWCFCIAVMIEIGSEYFGLGPIYRKRGFNMEYLKTGYGGMELLRKAVRTDSILRCVRCLIYIIVPALIVESTDYYTRAITAGFILAWVSVISVNVTRYISIFSFMFLVNIPFLVPSTTMYAVARLLPGMWVSVLITSVILLIGGFFFSDWLLKKKIKDSYIDR